MREFERVEVASRAEWRRWLSKNHTTSGSIWLVTFKKRCPEKHVPYDAVVEEALCFGWIDSLPRALDEDRSMLLLSPRKPGSAWSALNKRRAVKLDKLGLLAPPGRAVIERAKADGSWSLLDDVESLAVPPDLAEALGAVPNAAENFAAFSPSSRKGILWWIKSAKSAATRARRLSETARLAAAGLRANFPESRGR